MSQTQVYPVEGFASKVTKAALFTPGKPQAASVISTAWMNAKIFANKAGNILTTLSFLSFPPLPDVSGAAASESRLPAATL